MSRACLKKFHLDYPFGRKLTAEMTGQFVFDPELLHDGRIRLIVGQESGGSVRNEIAKSGTRIFLINRGAGQSPTNLG